MPTDTHIATQSLRRIAQILATASAIAALYWGREIILPIMLAILLAFLLTPATRVLERWGLHRIPAVVIIVMLGLVGTSGLVWIVASQLVDVSTKMPQYKGNLLAKVRVARQATQTSLTRAAETIQDLGQELGREPASEQPKSASLGQRLMDFLERGEPGTGPKDTAVNVRVVALPPSPIAQLRAWLGPLVAPLTSSGIVVVLVIFLLIHREDLRNRMLQLVGTHHLHDSTMAINEAGRRVSHYLRMQLLLNTLYGVAVAVGLACIGIPNALLWGVLGIAFRFVPYIGPWFVFAVPLTLSLAISETWFAPLATIGLFLSLEIVLNNVLEPWLYGRGTGVSSVGVIVSVIVWAWLWGPVGLVLATPITVCLVVMGRHFPPLQFMATLFGEEETLLPHERLYQRLLVDDWDEVLAIVEAFIPGQSVGTFLDELIVPVLQWIESARSEDRLSDEHAERMMESVVAIAREVDVEELRSEDGEVPVPASISLWITAGRDMADQTLSRILHDLLERMGTRSELVSRDVLVSELADRMVELPDAVLLALAVSPAAGPYALHLAKRMQHQGDQLHVVVQRADGSSMARGRDRLERAGASVVSSRFSEWFQELSQRRPRSLGGRSNALCMVRQQAS